MAQMTAFLSLLVALLAFSPTARATALDIPPEQADAKAFDAFKEYWNSFEQYEGQVLGEGQKEFKKSWDEVKKNYQKEQAKLSAEQLATLQKSAAKYRKHLEEHATAENRPYVMLNLAQILSMIGDQLSKGDSNSGTFAKSEALAMLGDLDRNYPGFAYREQTLYLRAVVLESMERNDDALAAWQALASTARSTIYGVHARVAAGDHLFQRERAGDAMRSYQKALELLPDVNAQDPEYEKIRINYRLAWAAYRATELNVVVQATAELLQPGRRTKTVEQRDKIQQDAVDLMGDSLYENNSVPKAKDVLKRKELTTFAAAVGLRTIKKFNGNNIHNQATELGEFLIDELPLAKEAPEILAVTADSWNKFGKPQKGTATLEKLALLLPAQSLWRARHKDDMVTTKKMEEEATRAAEAVASAHYDLGLASGNPKAFTTAGSFYDILLDHSANAAQSNEWRLRRAHCQYFAGNHDEAAKMYEALKKDYKVDPETLQIAAYQLVLTNEKRWRDAFAKASEKAEDPLKDVEAGKVLGELEKSIDEFAARFPAQARSVDLLLVGASANRDMDRYDNAAKYWQRALVSQPSPAQRGIAVRGLVFASMKTGSSGDVVDLARRFLKLEDWAALGLNLGTELRGVLSAAALDEGKRLNNTGKVLEAGMLLTQIADEFPDIPDRDRIFRDGSYMLAIAGDWAKAQRAAENYFKAGLLKNRADMTYLLARAHEYQLRLHDAAEKYLDLGDKYPKHSRAQTSLARAEKLAIAEGDFDLAARAAAAQAERAPTEALRLANYARAAEYLNKDGNATRALSLARKRLRSSKSLAERMRSQLLVARMTYNTGSEREAMDEIEILGKQIEKSRGKLNPEEFASISGEVNFLLGEEARRKFEDFRIKDRAGSESANVAQKSKYFGELVQSYDKAAASGDPQFSSEARYRLATAAEGFADEIASVPTRSNEQVTTKSQNRYQATIDRLQALAKKYHSTNVLAARKDPGRFKDNEWVKKSSLRITGEVSENPEARHKDIMPASVQENMPLSWSL